MRRLLPVIALSAVSLALSACAAKAPPMFQVRAIGQADIDWPQGCTASVDPSGWGLACPTVAGRLSRVAYPRPEMFHNASSREIYWGKVIASFSGAGWRSAPLAVKRQPWGRAVVPVRAWRVSHRGSTQDLYVSLVRMYDDTVRGFSCSVSKGSDPERMGCPGVLVHLAKRASATKMVALVANQREYTFEGCELGDHNVLCLDAQGAASVSWLEHGRYDKAKDISFPEDTSRAELERLGARIEELPARCAVAGLATRCNAIRAQLPERQPAVHIWAYGEHNERAFSVICTLWGERVDDAALSTPCSPLMSVEFGASR